MKVDEPNKKMMKQAVFVTCKECTPLAMRGQFEPEIVEFELIDVMLCPHTDVLRRIFNPTWSQVQRGEEVNNKDLKSK